VTSLSVDTDAAVPEAPVVHRRGRTVTIAGGLALAAVGAQVAGRVRYNQLRPKTAADLDPETGGLTEEQERKLRTNKDLSTALTAGLGVGAAVTLVFAFQ
jgi:hypothetical protein